jgi:two-component system response regulator HydG
MQDGHQGAGPHDGAPAERSSGAARAGGAPPAPRVLVVDDERAMAETLAEGLEGRGFEGVAEGSGPRALARIEKGEAFDAVVTDLRMAQVDGLAVLAAARRADPERPVIVMTAYGAIDTAVESIRRGANHYLVKPFKLDELVIFLRRALDEVGLRREARDLRRALGERFARERIVGRSAAMRAVLEVLDRVAGADVPVLITGETGTGKGLLAGVIHAASPRAQGPFVTVNCAALPENLLESELFGHVKGAFTGATRDRAGLFAEASGGTLFLDEVGEMSPALQSKLLGALERGLVRPLGGSGERAVDVRVLAATHQDLREAVAQGRFREDLLYRLEVVPVELPPLRRRPEDLPELIEHFLRVARERHPGSPVRVIGRDALARMLAYRWPGNVRELAHGIERLVLLGRGEEVTLADLPPTVREGGAVTHAGGGLAFGGEVIPVRELQRRYAAWALDALGGNRTRTAEKLGIDGKTLARWLAADDP